VEHGAVFSGIDVIAAPHCVDAAAQIRGVRKCNEQSNGLVIDALAGKIEIQARSLARESPPTVRIRVA
jgi:hypothetical protein